MADIVLVTRELLFVGDSVVDGEREREHNDDERRDVAGVRTCAADGERDRQRTAATSDDDGGSTVHDVPIIQRSQIRAEGLHGRRQH